MKSIFWIILASLITLIFYTSCSNQSKQEKAPIEALSAQSIQFQYAIYYLPSPLSDPLVALRGLLKKDKNMPTLIDEIPKAPDKPFVRVQTIVDVQKEYSPPGIQSLQYFGRGLTREQAEQLQKSRNVFVMYFAHPKANVWDALRTANKISELLARETGGLLWDEETREVFSPDEWHRKRIASWVEDIPDMSDHTTIHAYKPDEYVRAITLGMSKMGMPDVVVENFSWSLSRTMGHLINLFCQAIAEGTTIDKQGTFDLDIRMIRNKKVRDPQMESLKLNATAIALLSLKKGKWMEGDPKNSLIEISFDRYEGRDVHARQEKMLSSLFGWEDSIIEVDHNEQLLAASQSAKAQLPALQKAFTRGLQPGEFIQVKAPFATPDGGHEWMWLEITAWEEKKIKGLLKNEPFDIPSLHAGQIVVVNQEDVFDYIRRYPDGRQEGNETGAIIEKMQQ